MAFIDYYKILGVDKNIPQKDVRMAYRKRAKLFHPDLHPNDPKAKAKFQALNEAYDVISNPDKRAKYDRYGEQWKQADAYGQATGSSAGGGFGRGGGGDPFAGFDFNSFGGGTGGFSSFFDDILGGGRSRNAGFGGGGYSRADYSGQRTNTGQIDASVNVDMYAALLGGDGVVALSNGQKFRLKIKPGTQTGTKVRLRGKGYDRGDGTYGDLIITYKVKLPESLNEKQKDLLRQMRDAK